MEWVQTTKPGLVAWSIQRHGWGARVIRAVIGVEFKGEEGHKGIDHGGRGEDVVEGRMKVVSAQLLCRNDPKDQEIR